MTKEDKFDILFETIQQADYVLIGAGAGLSAAGGISFADEKIYKQYYPYWFARGLRSEYQMFSFRDWTKAQEWAYMAKHVCRVRYDMPPLELYRDLKKILDGKDYYVLTSNVDRQFFRNGFPRDRVFEYQGAYDWLYCSEACSAKVWDFEPVARQMVERIREEDFSVPVETFPVCPNCGAPLRLAFRDYEDYAEAKMRYNQWLEHTKDGLLCIIEMGVGFNSPGVIRVPFERITGERDKEKVKFFRITVDYPDSEEEIAYPEIPRPIEDKSLSLNYDLAEVIAALLEKKENLRKIEKKLDNL